MASSSTTVTTIMSSTTASPSSSPSDTRSNDEKTPCNASQLNTTGLSGPVCQISTFVNSPYPLPNIASCCVTPTDVRSCGNSTRFCVANHSNDNITMTREQLTMCVENLYEDQNSSYAISVSCSNFQNGNRVNGANTMGNGIYEGAMGIWALVMVMSWTLNLI